ncbi:hypothetical protein AVEN_142438-1 [Araneus ventricosus]|uniref:Uncharacterized protein n=1 Tax=Araneus ventricosus TaxID=182803 RepID=A0A4Y2HC19_ARAVE|nr:hypothetical protein AVEN_142438-1 [Araneus ventricosus]
MRITLEPASSLQTSTSHQRENNKPQRIQCAPRRFLLQLDYGHPPTKSRYLTITPPWAAILLKVYVNLLIPMAIEIEGLQNAGTSELLYER